MPAYDCPDCGEPHPRGCHGHSIRCGDPSCNWSGGNTRVGEICKKCKTAECIRRPCKRPPTVGAVVCDAHGSGAPNVKKKAERRAIETLLEKEKATMLADRPRRKLLNPYLELQDLISEIIDVKDFFRERVEELTSLKDVGSDKLATQIDVLVSAYERGLDRGERALANLVRLNLDAHIASLNAHISEELATRVRACLDSGIKAVGELTPEQAERIRFGFGQRMRGFQQEQAALEARYEDDDATVADAEIVD